MSTSQPRSWIVEDSGGDAELREGKRPPQNDARAPGEWPHGWQYWAFFADTHYRRISMLTGRPASRGAHLRSHSGHNVGVVLSHAQTAPEHTVPLHLFRMLLLEHWVSRIVRSEVSPPCRLSTNREVAQTATPTERMLARICREAGARVKYHAFLRDMNVHVRPDDERRIEVLTRDLPCFGGTQRRRHHIAERVGEFRRTKTTCC